MTESKNFPNIKQNILFILGGIIFGILGLSLFGYTVYILLNKTDNQKITEILPIKDLEFVIMKNPQKQDVNGNISNYTQTSSFLKKIFPNVFTKKGTIAIYKNNEILLIEPKEKNISAPKGLYCEEIKNYWFCAEEKNKIRVISVIDLIKNKKYSPLSLQKEFREAQKFYNETKKNNAEEFFFFGKTSFFTQVIWKNFQFLLPSEIKEGIYESKNILSKTSPYTFGFIQKENFAFFLMKEKFGKIFPPVISAYDFSEDFLPTSVDRFLIIKKPKFIWDKIFSLFEENHLSTQFITKKVLEKSFSTFFSTIPPKNDKNISLNFDTDILPLFEGDVLWTQTQKGSAIIYSLPKKNISFEVFKKFSHVVENIAQWSIPIKVEHTLQDGTKVFEVFPNTENIIIDKAKDKNGEKIIFTNKENNTSLGVILRDTFLMVSNEKNIQNHFWELQKKGSSFIFPKGKNIFFSFGLRKRKDEIISFDSIDVFGTDENEYISISGKIFWNKN